MSHLHVLYAFDENYAPFCGVSVTSLLENNLQLENITIHLMGDRISEENQKKFRRTAEHYKREIIFYEAQAIVERIEQYGMPLYRGSYATNMRLFFSEIVQLDSDRLLYLDSDTIVVGDLGPLLTLDFEGKACGLVQESLGQYYKKLIGFSPDDPYYNAGVLLINVPEWKRQNCSHNIMHYLTTVSAQLANNDQDVINIVLKDSIIQLSPTYNLQPMHLAFSLRNYRSVYKSACYYADAAIEGAIKSPAIYHTYRFIGQFPWHDDVLHPCIDAFDGYLARSQWQEFEKKKPVRSLVLKIDRLLYQILPPSLFLHIFALSQYFYFLKLTQALNTSQADEESLCGNN